MSSMQKTTKIFLEISKSDCLDCYAELIYQTDNNSKKKNACSIENIETILDKKGVQLTKKPSSKVSHFKTAKRFYRCF